MLTALLVFGVTDWSNFTFTQYKNTYNRVYNDAAEEKHHGQAFDASLRTVLIQNAKYAAGKSTWYAAINAYSDLTDTEFSATKKGLLPHSRRMPGSNAAPLEMEASTPDAVDWRKRLSPGGSKVITPVKDQGGCGSCWAFASTATIESYYALATDELAVLAPQTLVNCAPNPDDCGGTGGCEGSIPELAFNFTRTTGIALETDLPYKGRDEPCVPYKAKATLEGYAKLPTNSAVALEAALAAVGPVSVNVAANWRHYSGGIFSGGCTEDSCVLDHVVVATGYQKDDASQTGGYCTPPPPSPPTQPLLHTHVPTVCGSRVHAGLIRNSWGADWGEEGYIRLTRSFDTTTFIDKTPASGVACKPFPKTQSVMGESGVLLDMSYPTGVRAAA